MRAAMVRAHGAPEVVVVEDVAEPALEAGSVRVAVEAAAVNFPDVLIVANQYQVKVPPPFTPGSEFAGTVIEVAPGVEGLRTGQRVFGTTMVGAFAEQLCIPAAAVKAVPEGVDPAAAAAFGVAHRTAYHTLRSVAGLERGEELIVLGAGGGVGLASVQLGVALGARVTAVASSPEKLEAARSAGAALTVDHTKGDPRSLLKELHPSGADVAVDPVGGPLAEAALRSLRWGGRFVTVGYASGEIPRLPLNLVLLKGVTIAGFEFRGFVTHRAAEAARNEGELLDLLSAGAVSPHIGARFPLEETARALRYVSDGRAIGKVVIEVGAPLK